MAAPSSHARKPKGCVHKPPAPVPIISRQFGADNSPAGGEMKGWRIGRGAAPSDWRKRRSLPRASLSPCSLCARCRPTASRGAAMPRPPCTEEGAGARTHSGLPSKASPVRPVHTTVPPSQHRVKGHVLRNMRFRRPSPHPQRTLWEPLRGLLRLRPSGSGPPGCPPIQPQPVKERVERCPEAEEAAN
jgi:hypothetical protein